MTIWQPSRIRWVVQQVDSSTGAVRVETDVGPAYAKLLGNKEGPQALFCDLVGTRAAAWLGLPTFRIATAEVEEAGLVTYADGSLSEAGAAFFARAEEGTTWGGTSAELAGIANKDAISGLVVLDTWLRNCDRFSPAAGSVRRNTRNVFLSADGAPKGRHRLVAMDHTHCFTCGNALTTAIRGIQRTKDDRLYGHFPEFRGHLSTPDVRAYASRLGSFQASNARELQPSIPPKWAPSEEIRDALADFMKDRARFVADNVEQMLVDQGFL